MTRFAEIVGTVLGVTLAFIWVLFRMRWLTIPAFLLGLACGLLSGCTLPPPKWEGYRFDSHWNTVPLNPADSGKKEK